MHCRGAELMATNERYIEAQPERVFDVLADGWAYSNWVVGTSHMRAVDASWPARGSKLHHASGPWPLALRDESVVDVVEPNRRLELTVRGRPLGEAKVMIALSAEGDGTKVIMNEEPISGPGHWVHNSVTDRVLARRNTEALDRLAAIAERRTDPDD